MCAMIGDSKLLVARGYYCGLLSHIDPVLTCFYKSMAALGTEASIPTHAYVRMFMSHCVLADEIAEEKSIFVRSSLGESHSQSQLVQ